MLEQVAQIILTIHALKMVQILLLVQLHQSAAAVEAVGLTTELHSMLNQVAQVVVALVAEITTKLEDQEQIIKDIQAVLV